MAWKSNDDPVIKVWSKVKLSSDKIKSLVISELSEEIIGHLVYDLKQAIPFFRKCDIVLPPPLLAAGKTGGKSTRRETGLSDGERERLERIAGDPRSLRKHA